MRRVKKESGIPSFAHQGFIDIVWFVCLLSAVALLTPGSMGLLVEPGGFFLHRREWTWIRKALEESGRA